MDRIFPLNQLEVIGCKEVPAKDPAIPRLLSAIFAVRGADTVLLPPYTIGEQEVVGPLISTRDGFKDLSDCEEATQHHITEAKSDYELWLDDEGNINYTPALEARRKLAQICQAHCDLAVKEMGSGSWVEARIHAIVAYSANPKNLQPLVYRAAAEELMATKNSNAEQIRDELSLTEMIAKSLLPIPLFRMIYRELVQKYSPKSPAPTCKYFGIAHKRPASPRIKFPEIHTGELCSV